MVLSKSKVTKKYEGKEMNFKVKLQPLCIKEKKGRKRREEERAFKYLRKGRS